MHDIHHYFQINCPIDKVFQGISDPEMIDQWWAVRSEGKAEKDGQYKLGFDIGYNWEAKVISYSSPTKFGLQIFKADNDWVNTTVLFELSPNGENQTNVHFHHTGWKEDNEHYRISNYCWAMYLRVLKRYLEHGEEVPYEDRLIT
jgi:uncharacterized protein YndB with AHSA1/START domain